MNNNEPQRPTHRPQVTVYYGTFTANVLRVHNNQHAWTQRESCPVCRSLGVAWVREGMPEVDDRYI